MKKSIVNLIKLFLILSPFFDIITAFMIKIFDINFTISMLVRFFVLFICLFYLIFIYNQKDKKYFLLVVGVIFIYLLIFLTIMVINKDISILLYEGKNAIKTFYLPILLITFFAISKENKDFVFDKIIIIVYIVYLLGIFIPDILGIGFDSYEVTKTGSVGFFYTANEVSAIISILMPFFLFYLYQKKNFILTVLFIGILVFDILSIGTKGPLLSFFIILGIIVFIYIIYLLNVKLYKILALFISVLALFIFFISFYLPQTAFYKNIKVHLDFLGVDNVFEVLTDYKLFDHFVFSSRLSFLNNTYQNYNNSSLEEKLFGIGYMENYNTNLESTKMIEMDYFDILFRHGVIGFIIYMGIFIYFLIKFINSTIFLKSFPFKVCNYLSLTLILLLSFITGHVLLAPSVSIFIVVIFVKKGDMLCEN